jgi:hypothetical protein
MPRAALAVVFVAVALDLASGATAGSPNRPQIRFTPADQAAAKASVLRRADLGSSGWSGGPKKPDLSSTLNCPGFHPKQSDLVVTGAAEADYKHVGLQLQSYAQVLKSRSMVARDWQRTVAAPKAFACLRSMLTKPVPANERVVSFKRLAFPKLSHFTAAYRTLVDVDAGGQHVLVFVDLVLVGHSRTELTLNVEAPAAARAGVFQAEVRMARALLARARA